MAERIGEGEEMHFLDHLEELRWRIIRAIIGVVVFAIIAFLQKDILFDVIIFGPTKPNFLTYNFFCWLSENIGLGENLCFRLDIDSFQNIEMVGQFTYHIFSSLIFGFILAFPYVFYQFWAFIKPGLTKTEVKSARGMVFWVSLLFMSGVLFAYFVICPLTIKFLSEYSVADQIKNIFKFDDYISTINKLTLITGLFFQMPILIYFLSKLGLVSPKILKKYRKHALVGVLVLSAIITPPDVASQILVSIPIIFLYEIGILISKRVTKKMQTQN
ncbi:MAG: twin-arginine translocase subunit TatC [Bacteroidota bacterium]